MVAWHPTLRTAPFTRERNLVLGNLEVRARTLRRMEYAPCLSMTFALYWQVTPRAIRTRTSPFSRPMRPRATRSRQAYAWNETRLRRNTSRKLWNLITAPRQKLDRLATSRHTVNTILYCTTSRSRTRPTPKTTYLPRTLSPRPRSQRLPLRKKPLRVRTTTRRMSPRTLKIKNKQ